MLTKAGLNAEAYLFSGLKPKKVYKLKIYFIENLPINSKATVLEELDLKEGDYVVINQNVFTISQRIVNRHPVKKNFESCEYRLTLVNQLKNLPKIKAIIDNV